jgi:DNA primase
MIYQIEKYIEANNAALEFFLECRKRSEKAQKYLKKRLSPELVQKYKIGYAPEIGLVRWFEHKKTSLFHAERLGLIGTSGSSQYQVFKTRIMIPIIHAGIIVGFGGRTLEPDKSKYINSRSSVLYQKKDILYNMHQARKSIDRLGFALLVEGYFDVLGLADQGVLNAVATCGTSFGFNQARLLKRYTDKVYAFFDGDEAGKIAAKKAKEVLQRAGIYAGRFLLPSGFDPDTYIKKYGKKALNKLEVIH